MHCLHCWVSVTSYIHKMKNDKRGRMFSGAVFSRLKAKNLATRISTFVYTKLYIIMKENHSVKICFIWPLRKRKQRRGWTQHNTHLLQKLRCSRKIPRLSGSWLLWRWVLSQAYSFWMLIQIQNFFTTNGMEMHGTTQIIKLIWNLLKI